MNSPLPSNTLNNCALDARKLKNVQKNSITA